MNIFLIFNRRNHWRPASKISRTFHFVGTSKDYNVTTTECVTGRRKKSIYLNFLNEEIKKENQKKSIFNEICNWNTLKDIQTNKNCWKHLHIRPYFVKRNDIIEKTVNVTREVGKEGKLEEKWNKDHNKNQNKDHNTDQNKDHNKDHNKEAKAETNTKAEKNIEWKQQEKNVGIKKPGMESQKLQEKEKKESIWRNKDICNMENVEDHSIKNRFKSDKEILRNFKKEENEKYKNIEKTNCFMRREDVSQADTFKINCNEMKKGNNNDNDNNNNITDTNITDTSITDTNITDDNNNNKDKDNNNNSYLKQRNESSLDKNMLGKNNSILNGKNHVNSANYSMYIEAEKEITKNIKDQLHRISEKNIKGLKKNEKFELLNCCINKLKNHIHNLFEKHLLIMNCVIAGTLYFIADITCQLMEKKKEKIDYDFFRTFRMAFIGISLEGPIMTWWYGKILAQFVKSKPNTFFYKSFLPTLFDNFIFGPIHLTVFFFYNGILKKQCKEEIKEKIRNTGIKVFIISLMTWTPLTLINFCFVPRLYQATVIFFADFFWVNFLSWSANKKG